MTDHMVKDVVGMEWSVGLLFWIKLSIQSVQQPEQSDVVIIIL